MKMSILNRDNVRTLFWAGVVSLGAGLLYFMTAARDFVVGDSPELITAAVILGVPHPPGYPLFTMLGHLFSLLPIGPIPFRVNLVSVVCDALAVGVVFLTAFRLSQSRLASAVAALILALNPLFWSWSLAAEVFPLNNLLASLMIYFVVVWYQAPDRAGSLIIAAFVAGLALANHHTIVLLGPAVCFVLWQRRAVLQRRPQIVFLCAIVFCLGLLPYLYVLWAAARHPAYNWGHVSSLSDLFRVITRQSYGGHHLVAPAFRGGSSLDRILALFASMGALINLFGLLGLVYAWRHCRSYFWFVLLGFVFTGPFFAKITNLNLAAASEGLFVLERFFLLPQVVIAPLLALGIVMVAGLVASHASVSPARSVPLVAGALALVLIIGVVTNYSRIDQSHNHIARLYAEDVFATIKPDTILLASGDGLALPLIYLNTVERVRPDVTIIVPMIMPANWYVQQLRETDPRLKIPFDSYDGANNNLRQLVRANPDRPFAIVGPVPDNSLAQDYQPHLFGLVNFVEPKWKTITLAQMVSDNEELMKKYRPPKAGSINPKSFENGFLLLYANPAWQIGIEYEKAGWKTEARTWYQRALAINPDFTQAQEALARVN